MGFSEDDRIRKKNIRKLPPGEKELIFMLHTLKKLGLYMVVLKLGYTQKSIMKPKRY
jgi:hypothetical protein